MRSYEANPAAGPRDTPGVEVQRASERVTLACKALSAAANDLRIAHARRSVAAVDDVAEQIGVETERVCELAEELAKLARNVQSRSPAPAMFSSD